MPPTPQLLGALVVAVALISLVVWLHTLGRREKIRRSQLSETERKRLEREDAIWSQRYGF